MIKITCAPRQEDQIQYQGLGPSDIFQGKKFNFRSK